MSNFPPLVVRAWITPSIPNTLEVPKKDRFEECCDQWLACYQVCGASKKYCDEDYGTCTKKRCLVDEECNRNANMLKMMAKLQRCKTYDGAQQNACECVETSKVATRCEEVVRAFYNTYAPENSDKAAELARKAGTKSKMAALMRKLVGKYPESTQKVAPTTTPTDGEEIYRNFVKPEDALSLEPLARNIKDEEEEASSEETTEL
jgi:hypothetical protein